MKLVTDDGYTFAIEHVRVAELGPSDVVVLKVTGRLPSSAIETLHERLTPLFPDNQILVLDDDACIEIHGEGRVESLSAGDSNHTRYANKHSVKNQGQGVRQ